MKAHEADVLISGFKQLVEKLVDGREVVATGPTGDRLVKPNGHAKPEPPALPSPRSAMGQDDLEKVYQYIKRRLLDDLAVDPIFMQLLAVRPEIEVLLERRKVTLDTSTLKGRVARLIAQGFFASAKATSAVRAELKRTGSDPGGGGGLSDVLGALKRDGFLTDMNGGYVLAPDVKVSERDVTVVS
jgi:hypothetical protein